jgi:hypothetical protein
MFDEQMLRSGLANIVLGEIAPPEPQLAIVIGKVSEHHLRDKMVSFRRI